MNRLILIGNGFDLAHHLKTSYCDFIKDYISRAINRFLETNSSIDPLLDIRLKYSGGMSFRDVPTISPENALGYLKSFQDHDYITATIKSDFLKHTINRISEVNWVDLENDYFDQLLSLKRQGKFDLVKVKTLNTEFDFLKNQLETYLQRQQNASSQVFSNEYVNIFCEPFNAKDIVTTYLHDNSPRNILILNFNYTNTLEKYKKACSAIISNISINYIHGQLGLTKNPLIFGFGDEFNKDYLEFENLKSRELLTHIKSYGYFKTSNYHDLVRFMQYEDFQVYTFGHSLGLSDRTMLKQIFEHERCKSIKIFYHQKSETENDYTTKTYDASSHFTDKIMMRNKIVPFDKSFAMPQIN